MKKDRLKNLHSLMFPKNNIERTVKNAFFSKIIDNVLNVHYIYALYDSGMPLEITTIIIVFTFILLNQRIAVHKKENSFKVYKQKKN